MEYWAVGGSGGQSGCRSTGPFCWCGHLLVSGPPYGLDRLRALARTVESGACSCRSPRHRNESGEENSDKAACDRTARDDDAPVGYDVAEALRDAMTQDLGRVRVRRATLGLRRMMKAPDERSSEPGHERQAEDQVAELVYELASLTY